MQKFYVIQQNEAPLYYSPRTQWTTLLSHAYFWINPQDCEFGIRHNQALRNCKILEVTMFTKDYVPNAEST